MLFERDLLIVVCSQFVAQATNSKFTKGNSLGEGDNNLQQAICDGILESLHRCVYWLVRNEGTGFGLHSILVDLPNCAVKHETVDRALGLSLLTTRMVHNKSLVLTRARE